MVNEQPTADQGQSGRPTTTSIRLQILSTEHWSLLATRSLTYGESFSRVGMFLTVLTGAVVSLALLAQVGHFGGTFMLAALLILSVVLFIGLATIGRLSALNREDVRWVAGMNRLRRAYLEIDPELEPYFLTDSHDDMRGVMLTMGIGTIPGRRRLGDAVHGFTTLPAVMGVIVSVLAGVLGSLIVSAAGGQDQIVIVIGAICFLAVLAVLAFLAQRAFITYVKAMPSQFPSSAAMIRP